MKISEFNDFFNFVRVLKFPMTSGSGTWASLGRFNGKQQVVITTQRCNVITDIFEINEENFKYAEKNAPRKNSPMSVYLVDKELTIECSCSKSDFGIENKHKWIEFP